MALWLLPTRALILVRRLLGTVSFHFIDKGIGELELFSLPTIGRIDIEISYFSCGAPTFTSDTVLLSSLNWESLESRNCVFHY